MMSEHHSTSTSSLSLVDCLIRHEYTTARRYARPAFHALRQLCDGRMRDCMASGTGIIG